MSVRQVGIALVGMSSLLSREGGTQDVSAKQMFLGMALIVMSQVSPSACFKATQLLAGIPEKDTS